jgi:rhomboid family GlyGly-CTERM serine protease
MKPFWTLGICAAALAVFSAPQLEALLVYNRSAIEEGELWRLLTGNLVHLSPAHLMRDLIPLFLAGSLLESARGRDFPVLCLLSGTIVGAALYLTEPSLLVYGGMSGIVTAVVVYLCLNGLADDRAAYRALCVAALILVGAKILLETAFGASIGPEGLIVVPLSHAVGAATAAVLFALDRHVKLFQLRRASAMRVAG